jgi:rare lipoprotein A (peptidoglycan hydrolase)
MPSFAFGRLAIAVTATAVFTALASQSPALAANLDTAGGGRAVGLMNAALKTPVASDAPRLAVFERGIASTYGEGDGFEGNRTACGQIFHTNVVQIAHKTLPCGTVVRVENLDTGHSVDAEVTDRGPYVPGRVVDLSWAAFQQLDPTAPGLLHVNLYVLNQ